MSIEGERVCVVCGDSKKFSEFGLKKKSLDTRCSPCAALASTDWRKFSEAGKAWLEKPRKRKGKTISAAKRARELRRSIALAEARIAIFKAKLAVCEEAARVKEEKRMARFNAAVANVTRIKAWMVPKEVIRTKREVEIDNEIMELRRVGQ